MSLHSVRPTTPPTQLASRLLAEAGTAGNGQSVVRTLRAMARRGDWHAVWCRLGDMVDDVTDVAVAWLAVALTAVAVVAAGAVIGFAGGLIAAAAYVALVGVVVALYRRWLGRRSA